MTKLIGFGRCLGKTTMAILESHATGSRILVANQKMAENTFGMAQELGYTIPYPICPSDLVRTPHAYSKEEHFIIDNVEMVLQNMLYNKVDTITFDNRTIDPEDRYLEEIRTLKQEVEACYREKAELYQDIHDKDEHIERLKRSNIELTQALSDTIYTDMRAKARYRQQDRKWRAR